MNKSIQYFQQGHGPKKILFLHGWLSDYKIYEPILPYFNTEKYTVVCPDFRGYGKSKLITGKYTLDEISQDVINLLESLNWTEIDIVGHSMAGQVIQKIALKKPRLINKGIAITPVPASGFTMDEDTQSFFQSSFDDDATLAQIFHTLTGNRNSDAFINYLVNETRKTTTREAYLGYLNAWTKTNFANEVNQLKTPIVVIAGAHDGAFNPNYLKKTILKELDNVRMEVIETSGHYPMQIAPVELFQRIEKAITY